MQAEGTSCLRMAWVGQEDRWTNRQTGGQRTDIHKDRWIYSQTDRQKKRLTGRRIDRLGTDGQLDQERDELKVRQIH